MHSLARATMGMGFVLWAAGAAGCADGDVATGRESLALFRDPSSSGPRLDVYDFDGHPAISVSGPIGSEGMLDGLSRAGESLVDIYRVLHPTASTMPSELARLDQRIASDLAAARSTPRPPEPDAPATIEKSESAFNSQVCKVFGTSTLSWRPVECKYRNYDTLLEIGDGPKRIQGDDRTYGWNNTNAPATMLWFVYPGWTHAGEITLPAYWWNWTTASGVGPYSGAFYPGAYNGAGDDYGLTWHRRVVVVK